METKDKTNTRTLITLTFSLLAFSIISFSTFFAAFATAQDVEIPTLTPYVTDFAGVIEPQYKNAINDYASKLEASTTSEVAVLTVRSTQPMSIEEYAVKVFEKNGIGQKGKDNGVLVVVAVDDRAWRIEVGYGLEGQLNDAKAGRIGRTYMTTYFKEGKYGEGAYLAVRAIGDAITGNETSSFGSDYDYADVLDAYPVFAIMAVFIFVVLVSAVLSARCPKCGSWPMKTEAKGETVCRVCKKCGYRKCRKRGRAWPFIFFVGGGGSGGGYGGGGGGFGGGGSGGGGGGGSW